MKVQADSARVRHSRRLVLELLASSVDMSLCSSEVQAWMRRYGVEACGVEAQNTFAIAVAGRGFDARISTEFEAPLPESACVYCGNCIGVCPTGALMFRSEHELRKAGEWDESQQTVTDTICPYCGVGCELEVHVQDNEIVKVTSPWDNDVTSGHLCIKGRFGFQFVQNRAPVPETQTPETD